jgi:multicomponent Na+:H+ antiporter subunit D
MLSLPLAYLVPIAWMASLTMLYGALMCFLQTDLKRLLAFSSISQMGLILFGFVTTETGIVGSTFHALNHAAAKALLFLGSGVLLRCLATRNMDEMGGIAGRMPLTALSMGLAAAGLSATPPLSPFVSEVMIVAGGLEVNLLWPVLVVLIASILTAGYFFLMIYRIFLGGMPSRFSKVKERPYFSLSLSALSLPLLLLGIWPEPLLRMIT